MKIMKALMTLALIAIASSVYAAPQAVSLLTYNSRSGGGTLSTLAWMGPGTGCTPTAGSGCYQFSGTHAWTTGNIDPTGSTAAWTWDNDTGVLSMTGLFVASSFVGSNPTGTPILGDRVTDLVIDTVADTATGSTTYRCIEGTFLAGVGSHGCGSYSLGGNFANESSRDYMGPPADPVPGNNGSYVGAANGALPYCVVVTLGGDDASTGPARGAATAAAGGGCDATAGAFNWFTVASYSGGFLVLSNGIATTAPNTSYLTFAVPVPAAVWLFGSALGLLGWIRRRAIAA